MGLMAGLAEERSEVSSKRIRAFFIGQSGFRLHETLTSKSVNLRFQNTLIRVDGGRAEKSLRIPRVQGIPLLPHFWGVIDTLILCLGDLGLENWGKNDKHFERYVVVNYSIPKP